MKTYKLPNDVCFALATVWLWHEVASKSVICEFKEKQNRRGVVLSAITLVGLSFIF